MSGCQAGAGSFSAVEAELWWQARVFHLVSDCIGVSYPTTTAVVLQSYTRTRYTRNELYQVCTLHELYVIMYENADAQTQGAQNG